MIDIKGKCQIEVTLEGFDGLSNDNFIELMVEEDAGGMPSSFDLYIRQVDYRLQPVVRETNCPIKISYGKDSKTRKDHEFVIVNYKYTPKEDGTLTLVLTGILDVVDFVSKPAIGYVEGPSEKVFKSFSTVTPLVDYSGADDQVWLRHNITEKQWFDKVIHRVYISDDDVPLTALTVSKELIVVSAKKTLAKEPKYKFSNNEQGSYRVHAATLSSNTAYLSKFLSEGRQVQTVSLLKRELNKPTPKPTSIKGDVFSYTQENVQYPPVLDNGNCHDNYYKAEPFNLAKLVDFERNLVEFELPDVFFSDSDLKLLDPVHFDPSDAMSGVSLGPASGLYLVVSKACLFTTTSVKTSLTLGRV